jgi:SAM-dependent methyltransferase
MWDQRYAEPGFAFGENPNDFLVEVAERLPRDGPVLCLAEGEGRNAVWLAERGHQVVAVDASAVGLSKARDLATRRGVKIETIVADLREHVIERAAFAAVVSIFAHLPPDLRSVVHRKAATGLRPGGVFVLEAFRPEQLDYGTGGPPTRALLYTLDDLRADLFGLRLDVAREVVRPIHEGRYHNGQSAVVQILAERPYPGSLPSRLGS